MHISSKVSLKTILRRLARCRPRAIWFKLLRLFAPYRILPIMIDGSIRAQVRARDVLAEPLFLTGAIEEPETEFIKKNLRAGMVFVDAGANMGYYSLLAAKYVGSSGQVHSFEPNMRVYEDFLGNIRLNNFHNIIPNNLALGEILGVGKLSTYSEGREVYGSLSGKPYPGMQISGQQNVKITPLDGYLSGISLAQVDMIKMDVEGGELPLLKGAEKLLSSQRPPILVFEASEILAEQFGYSVRDIFAFLSAKRYSVMELSPGNFCAMVRTE